MYLSACLRSSPTIRTTEVVPSPVISSWAVAARAIMTCRVQCFLILVRSLYVPPWGFVFAISLLAYHK